jgi:hypothetical protein
MLNKVCPKCGFNSSSLIKCDGCQLIFSKYKEKYLAEDSFETSTQDSLKTYYLALPVVAFLSFIFANSFIFFVFTFFKVWIHEFGHAIMAWMSGIKATPLGFWTSGFTASGDEKSLFVFICFSFLLGTIGLNGLKLRKPFVTLFALFTIVLSMIFTWFTPMPKTIEFISFAGFGGEFILSTILIISFYYSFPEKIRWEYLRWPSLCIGLVTLIHNTQLWIKAYKLKSLTPFGANYSEAAVGNTPGDLYRLMVDYDWAFNKFTKVYLGICALSWIVIISHYLYFAFYYFPKRRNRL